MFSPKLETPVKTLDIPIGGKLYSAQTLPLILDFVNITNKLNNNFKDTLSDDQDGNSTIEILHITRKVARRINSIHTSSLGLHPIVYFYSQKGRHKIASFYATVIFLMELEERKKLNEFIKVRAAFESILHDFDFLVQQIQRHYRSSIGSYPYIKDYFFKIIDLLNNGVLKDEVINELRNDANFHYLTIHTDDIVVTSKDFTRERKSAVYIRDAIKSALKCHICNGYIHKNSITIDHIDRKEDGGVGSIDNGKIAHPYCNSTIKN